MPRTETTAILAPSSFTSHLSESEESDLFTVLPSFATPSMVVPWHTMSNSRFGPTGLQYRLRRVNTWAAKAGRREIVHRDEEIGGAEAMALLPGASVASEGSETTLKGLYETLSSRLATSPSDQPSQNITTLT